MTDHRILIAPALAGLLLGAGMFAQEAKPAQTAKPGKQARAGVPAAKLQAPPQDTRTQAEKQADYKARYADKLKKEFIAFGGWITDYDEARARARAEGKLLFTYFTRSYAP
ncbi:MAG: hypothetical protein D6702_02075 [Planctomycetota bacterium]|nr:MAG: hypothetical protein D6702_02075 [Planctomycetota bacterium]